MIGSNGKIIQKEEIRGKNYNILKGKWDTNFKCRRTTETDDTADVLSTAIGAGGRRIGD